MSFQGLAPQNRRNGAQQESRPVEKSTEIDHGSGIAGGQGRSGREVASTSNIVSLMIIGVLVVGIALYLWG